MTVRISPLEANVVPVRDTILKPVVCTAARVNDRFSRFAPSWQFTLPQQFPRGKRTQRENRIHGLGSALP